MTLPKVPIQKQAKKDVYCLAQYFTQMSLVDYNMAGIKVPCSVSLIFSDAIFSNFDFFLENCNLAGMRASVRAASAVFLAIKLLVDFSVEGS